MENDQHKEQSFVSAVVYLHNDSDRAAGFLAQLHRVLEQHFIQYEIIIVDNASIDDTLKAVQAWADQVDKPVTLLRMRMDQQREQCMNAGLDCAIGDFVYEFDTVEMPYDPNLIFEAYLTALNGGYDIVSVSPSHMAFTSRLFYGVFNRNNHMAYDLRTDAFRLVSRRAVNRVHAISEDLPYRKAAYAACGLRAKNQLFDGRITDRGKGRIGLATDSLVLYTNIGFKVSTALTATMFIIAFLELIYVLAVYFGGHPVEGWTTTMFVLTLGFTGVFSVLAIILKYVSLLLELVFKKQRYFTETITKY